MKRFMTPLFTVAALCSAGMLGGGAAKAAAVPGHQYFALGMGGGMLVNQTPCPDIPCNGNDVCSCVTSSGAVSFSTLTKTFPNGTYTLEQSVDVSSAYNNGSSGKCYGSTGMLTLTTNIGTLNLKYAGPACHLGASGGGPEAAPFGTSTPITIVSGSGAYENPIGTGSLSASFDPIGKTVLMDLVGYADLKRPGQ